MTGTEQIVTSIAQLDRLLRGGLRRGGLHLIVGEPGAGKTVLAHQIGAHHALEGRTVLYLTGLIESQQTLLSQMRTFRFFDAGSVSRTFYYASVAGAFENDGFDGVQHEIAALLRERKPDLVVLDGLHSLKSMARSPAGYHHFLNYLQAHCASSGVTMMLVSNRFAHDEGDPMYTIADGIFVLQTERAGRRRTRTIEIRKLRGVSHVTGSHVMEITGDGVLVYPRIESIVSVLDPPSAAPTGEERVTFGVDGLDAMIDGGLSGGCATLVAGAAGAGKTLLGLNFLAAGTAAGEPCLYVGFHETPDRLAAKAAGTDLDLQQHIDAGRLLVHWQPAAELPVDRVLHELLDTVDRRNVRRVVIDGADGLLNNLIDSERTIALLSALTDLLRARGISALLTAELRQIAGSEIHMPLPDISAAFDNAILLRYVEIDSELRRLISILKVRDGNHDATIREFTIDAHGIAVGDRFDAGDALLSGMVRRRDGADT